MLHDALIFTPPLDIVLIVNAINYKGEGPRCNSLVKTQHKNKRHTQFYDPLTSAFPSPRGIRQLAL